MGVGCGKGISAIRADVLAGPKFQGSGEGNQLCADMLGFRGSAQMISVQSTMTASLTFIEKSASVCNQVVSVPGKSRLERSFLYP